jgi:hypothetical protein
MFIFVCLQNPSNFAKFQSFLIDKEKKMNTISGITCEKDKQTGRRYVRIDIEQYQVEIASFLKKIGAIDTNDDFDKACASAISGEQLRERLYKKIDAWECSQTK